MAAQSTSGRGARRPAARPRDSEKLHMCVYIYIYTHTHEYRSLCVSLFSLSPSLSLYTYIYIYIYMYIYTHISLNCVYIHAHIYIYIYIYINIMCIHTYIESSCPRALPRRSKGTGGRLRSATSGGERLRQNARKSFERIWSPLIYIYIHTYVYIYISLSLLVCIYIYIYIYIRCLQRDPLRRLKLARPLGGTTCLTLLV